MTVEVPITTPAVGRHQEAAGWLPSLKSVRMVSLTHAGDPRHQPLCDLPQFSVAYGRPSLATALGDQVKEPCGRIERQRQPAAPFGARHPR
jgi:hypothetical protein